MKIALVIEHFDATRGGAEHVAVWLSGRLAERGHDVHVLCHDAKRRIQALRAAHQGASHHADRSEHSHGRPLADAPPGVILHRFRGLKLSTGLGFQLFGQMARRWCLRHTPDVAHSLTVAWAGDIYHPEAGVYAELQRQAVESRTTRGQAEFKRWMQRLSHKQQVLLALEHRATRPWEAGGPWKIISISGGMTRELARHYGVGPERTVRLDNPRIRVVSPANAAEDRAWFRSHYKLQDSDKVALFIGHDFQRKGLRWAIEAIAQTPDWKLLVAGLGKMREYVELVEERGLLERVRFIGPTREVERLYHAGDVLLLPVFYDPAPLVVIEALTAGLPVISTEHLGSADLVRDGQAGTIVDSPRNVPALAAALRELPTRGPEHAALTARAQQVAQGMPPEAFVDRICDLYAQCAGAKRRGSE